MLPKELLNDLEQGDRTMEMLEGDPDSAIGAMADSDNAWFLPNAVGLGESRPDPFSSQRIAISELQNQRFDNERMQQRNPLAGLFNVGGGI